METKWIRPGAEPSLRELMSDPIVLLLMWRDGLPPLPFRRRLTSFGTAKGGRIWRATLRFQFIPQG